MAAQHREALGEVGADGTATFILGGQVGDEPPDILLVYPEGNYIRASDDRPFLQIGESKYGKFMLELAVQAGWTSMTATKIALGLDDEHRAGEPVGGPALRRRRVPQRLARRSSEFRIESDSPLLERLRQVWEQHLMAGMAELPPITQDDLTDVVGSPSAT